MLQLKPAVLIPVVIVLLIIAGYVAFRSIGPLNPNDSGMSQQQMPSYQASKAQRMGTSIMGNRAPSLVTNSSAKHAP
jgi:hypothetical protein